MFPFHGNADAQNYMALVQIVPHAIRVNRGQLLKVTLRSVVANYTFRGFLVEARSQSNAILGNFMPNQNIKVFTCENSYSAACHADPSGKSEQLLTWKAPRDYRGSVYFR
jgi:hypothetical protein